MAISVTIRFVDGSIDDFKCSYEKFGHLRELQKSGLRGKRLINEWLTNDWGPPPQFVDIAGTTSDGQVITERLSYD